MPTHDRKFKEIFLSQWVPALITAVLGGAIVALVAPSFQTRFAEESAFKKRKIELWESIGENFTNYNLSRSRLNAAAISEKNEIKSGKTIDRDFKKRKESYRADRDKYLSNLRRDLLLAEYYYDKDVNDVIRDFLAMQEKYRLATVDQQPPDEKYDEWKERLMLTIRKNLIETYIKVP